MHNGTAVEASQTMTLEAFADTIIPGESRWPGDRAVPGAAGGGGAVASGALDLMRSPEGGIAGLLETLAEGLDAHARTYADECGVQLDATVPPFVALPFAHRTSLVQTLVAPEHPEREMWVALAMFTAMAWDTGASRSTVDAISDGHPGLTTMGFVPPDADGLWRFPNFSYGRPLARPHPQTTSTGDPA